MRTPRRFRPLTEPLEDRAVPSVVASVPAQDAEKVVQAFTTFGRSYNQDVKTILLPVGTTNPSANRAAFNAAVLTLLNTLDSAIDAAIANLPSATTLNASIEGELLGTGTTSLQSQLAVIPTPATRSAAAVQVFTLESSIDINQVATQVTTQVRTAAPPPAPISVQAVRQILGEVKGVFTTFSQTYSNAITTILDPPGTTTPSKNRAAFNTAVGTALTTLDNAVDSILGTLPAPVLAAAGAVIEGDLLTAASTPGVSLQTALAAQASPTSSPSSLSSFRYISVLDINIAEGEVLGTIVAAIDLYNGTLKTG